MGYEVKGEFDSNEKRCEGREAFEAGFNGCLRRFSLEELETLFTKAGVPLSRINSIKDAIEEPQTKAMGIVVESQEREGAPPRRYIDFPAHVSGHENVRPTCSPKLGQHTEEVLSDVCGYNREQLHEVTKEL